MLRHNKSVVIFQIEHSKTFLAAKLGKILLTQNPADFGYVLLAQGRAGDKKVAGSTLRG